MYFLTEEGYYVSCELEFLKFLSLLNVTIDVCKAVGFLLEYPYLRKLFCIASRCLKYLIYWYNLHNFSTLSPWYMSFTM